MGTSSIQCEPGLFAFIEWCILKSRIVWVVGDVFLSNVYTSKQRLSAYDPRKNLHTAAGFDTGAKQVGFADLV